jgi:2-aminobenzoate-CoA ligase
MSKQYDTFVVDRMPESSLLPDFTDWIDRRYPSRFNIVEELVDGWVAKGHGDHTALIGAGVSWTYDELFGRTVRYAAVLKHRLGLVPGNRVLLRGRNSPSLAALHLAVIRAGGIVVSTMPMLRQGELQTIIEKAHISHAICEADLVEDLNLCQGACSPLRSIATFQSRPGPIRDADNDIDVLASMEVRLGAVHRPRSDTPCLIAFTSGTTGNPKGAVHTHRDVLAICDTFAASILAPTRDDIFCGSPPLAFTYGLGGLLLFPLRFGASALLLPDGRPAALLEAIATYRPTVCFSAPTAYRAMIEMLPAHDVSSLRACVSAGETLTRTTFDQFLQACGLKIIDGIGSTELLHIFISAAGDDIRPGATGKVVPGYEAAVVDDHGNEVPPGVVGWLAVKGPTGCRYLDDDRQRSYVRKGWNITGDAFQRDRDGYFWYQSRMDDLIVSSGYKIAAPEVEAALQMHPAVAECAVVGIPCDQRGQRVKAFVVLRSGARANAEIATALQEHVKRTIAAYKCPRDIAFVEALPKTATGKLKRFELKVRDAA